VGEVLASLDFLRQAHADLPNARLFVSVSTLAGHATAHQKLHGVADGVFYAPIDFVFIVRRVLRALKPSVVVIAETEIWPNLFRETKRTGAGLLMVNGRISDRAYPRYRRFAWLFRAVLAHADAVLTQSDEMRARFIALGAPEGRTRVGGNFKYDFEARPAPESSPVRELVARIRPQQVWIAASTMPPDEDDAVLAAFRELAAAHPGLLLILVPRKPAMFDETAAKLAGLAHLRRSRLEAADELALPGVLLLDTIGELSGLFALADVVFMGGTLVDTGGHNILEPALFGKPVITGPHMENFRAIADEFRAAGASIEIANAAELAPAVARLLDGPEAAAAIGERGRAYAESKRGASASAAAEVRAYYETHLPRYRHALLALIFGWAAQKGWIAGGRRRARRASRILDARVISVGNLSMGGTGKSPCVLRVAELLKARGANPGILTRGYGRVSHEAMLALAPGTKMAAYHTGDEPQIFLRSGVAPVGIGANRYAVGEELIRKFHCDHLVLDDGFQHMTLERDVDIALIDALDPLAGGGVFPLGRLREPFSGIARADVVLITRAEFSDLAPAIEHEVRKYNTAAAIFCARLQARGWVNALTGEAFAVDQPPFQRVGAFCGLGNPQGFCRTLEQLGIEPVGWHEFPDHHHYNIRELRRLQYSFEQLKADAMVTTEKDVVNLPDTPPDMPVYYLRVGLTIDREEEFLARL
jgi:tetraacyldisaccharide 4'-kinase